MSLSFHPASSRARRLGMASAALGLLVLSAPFALAHEFKAGAIRIDHPWSRATPPGAKVGGGYVTLVNEGDSPDRLVSATFEGSGRAEIHNMQVQDGVMTMRPVTDGVEIPAHETVTFAPSGYHLMFLELKKPLVKGEQVAGTLTFEKAGTVPVKFSVDAIGASGKTNDHKGHGASSDAD